MAVDRGGHFRNHPFLAAYLVALTAVWAVTIATWSVRPGQTLDLHPVAQVLQYLLVVVAATLAALRIRVEPRDLRSGSAFAYYDLRWEVSDDIGGQAFWTALWVGAAAMTANVVLLALADLAIAGGAAGGLTYLEWIGAGIASGAILGMFSTFIAVAVAWLLRRRGA